MSPKGLNHLHSCSKCRETEYLRGQQKSSLTHDQQLARHAKPLTTTAKLPHRWDYVHDEVGFNYRMPNLNAALGCAQLEQLPDFLASKRILFLHYQQAFQDITEVALIKEPPECQSNYWLQTLKLSDLVVLL